MKPFSKLNMLFLFTMALGTTHAHAEPRFVTDKERVAALDKKYVEREKQGELQFKTHLEPVIKAGDFDAATKNEILEIVSLSPFQYGDGPQSLANILTKLSASEWFLELNQTARRNVFKAMHKMDPHLNDEILKKEIENEFEKVQKLVINNDKPEWISTKIPPLLAAGHNPNLKLSNGETPLAWIKRELDSSSSLEVKDGLLKMMKTLLAKGAFEKGVVDSLSKPSEKSDFERHLKSKNNLSYKNLFSHNDCSTNKMITNYIRLDLPDETVIPAFQLNRNAYEGKGYTNIHSQYRHYAFTFPTVQECEKRHTDLQSALDNNRFYGKAIVAPSADNWFSAGSASTPSLVSTVEAGEGLKPARTNH